MTTINEGGEESGRAEQEHDHDIWALEKIEHHMKNLTAETPKKE